MALIIRCRREAGVDLVAEQCVHGSAVEGEAGNLAAWITEGAGLRIVLDSISSNGFRIVERSNERAQDAGRTRLPLLQRNLEVAAQAFLKLDGTHAAVAVTI
jgi:hypothetical protein